MELCIKEPKVQRKNVKLNSRERSKLIKLFATVIVNHTIQKISNE